MQHKPIQGATFQPTLAFDLLESVNEGDFRMQRLRIVRTGAMRELPPHLYLAASDAKSEPSQRV